MNASIRILKSYIDKDLTTVSELAFLLDCSERRIYQVLDFSDSKSLYDYEIMKLAVHFSDMGRNELASLFKSHKYAFTPCGSYRINGSLLDESADITKIQAQLLNLFEENKREQGLNVCDQLIAMAMQTKAEFKNLD
jgi:hypothetical protein